jgi:predicted component of type VI protein secretion system
MRITTAKEGKPDELSMVILSLHYQGGKTYSINEDDIPPCLISSACAGIMSHRAKLMQLISERVHQLQAWLLGKKDFYALQEALILADSLLSLGQTGEFALEHPQKLFLQGARLMVQLGVLRGEWIQPEVYDHGKISILFQAQMAIFKRLLKCESAQTEGLPVLKQVDAHHHETNAIPEQYFKNHDWYLGVGYQNPDLTWVQRFCTQAKMAAPEQLFDVLSAALPGVTLMPTHHVPHQIQIRSGFEYFKIVQQGSFWREVVHQQSFKIYMPQPFNEAILTLVMVDVNDETI